MNDNVLKTRIQLRNDIEANWLAVANTFIPIEGEGCVTNDGPNKGQVKFGDGVSTWGQLKYAGSASEVATNLATIVKDLNGKLTLRDFARAEIGAHAVKGENGALTWIKPAADTIEEIGEKIDVIEDILGSKEDGTGLAGDVGRIEDILGKPASEDPVEEATGIFAELDKKADADSVYTKEDTNDKIAEAIASVDHLSRKIVSDISEIDVSAEGADKFIYMVSATNSKSQDSYDEYMVINGILERVGDWEVSLDGYATTDYVNDELAKKVDKEEGKRLISEDEIQKLAGIILNEDNSITVNITNVDGLTEVLDGKVSAEEGKGLSSNDLTDELLEKINGVSTGAQENVLESVTLGNTVLPVVDKNVTVPAATATSYGAVKGSTDENKIAVDADGTMEVNSLNVNRLIQTTGEELILNGGSSAQ